MNRRIVSLLSLGHLITDINQGAVPVLLPFLIAAHDLSFTAAAGIVFAVNVSSTIVQPLFGHAADRSSKPWLMPLGLVLAGSGLALTGIAPGYFLIILAAIVSGIGIAAYHPDRAGYGNGYCSGLSSFRVFDI
jgi:FSR family fosmidomycin resistance protein-like MFS transporter